MTTESRTAELAQALEQAREIAARHPGLDLVYLWRKGGFDLWSRSEDEAGRIGQVPMDEWRVLRAVSEKIDEEIIPHLPGWLRCDVYWDREADTLGIELPRHEEASTIGALMWDAEEARAREAGETVPTGRELELRKIEMIAEACRGLSARVRKLWEECGRTLAEVGVSLEDGEDRTLKLLRIEDPARPASREAGARTSRAARAAA